MPLGPITDTAALEYLEGLTNLPTGLSSAQIAKEWSEDTRFRSFFSARVAKADLLEGMRLRITQVISGQMTPGQAKEWVREFLVTDGASSMRELGFLATDEELNQKDVLSELGSTRRISLIVDQNVRMAQAVSEYQELLESAEFFPYVQYKTREDGRVRYEHAALNNTVWLVGSPELGRVFPPNDFRCRCFVEPLEEDEVNPADIRYTAPPDSELSPSGYTFNPHDGLSGNPLRAKDTWSPEITDAYNRDLEGAAIQARVSPVRKVVQNVLKWLGF